MRQLKLVFVASLFLAIGIATNIPSAVLYFILVPLFDNGLGAAISYTLGAIIGFIVSIHVARQVEMQIFWKQVAFIAGLPAVLTFLLSHFHVYYVIGIPVALVLSYLLLLKIQIITDIDIHDSLAIVPTSIANPLLNFWNTFGRKTNRIK